MLWGTEHSHIPVMSRWVLRPIHPRTSGTGGSAGIKWLDFEADYSSVCSAELKHMQSFILWCLDTGNVFMSAIGISGRQTVLKMWWQYCIWVCGCEFLWDDILMIMLQWLQKLVCSDPMWTSRHLSVVYSTTGGNQCMLERKTIIWNRIKIPKVAPLSKYK